LFRNICATFTKPNHIQTISLTSQQLDGNNITKLAIQLFGNLKACFQISHPNIRKYLELNDHKNKMEGIQPVGKRKPCSLKCLL
jgi:hypothetical protein